LRILQYLFQGLKLDAIEDLFQLILTNEQNDTVGSSRLSDADDPVSNGTETGPVVNVIHEDHSCQDGKAF